MVAENSLGSAFGDDIPLADNIGLVTDIDWSNPDNIPKDLPVDTQWDDVYQNTGGSVGNSNGEDFDLDSRNSQTEGLHEHLLWQLNLELTIVLKALQDFFSIERHEA